MGSSYPGLHWFPACETRHLAFAQFLISHITDYPAFSYEHLGSQEYESTQRHDGAGWRLDPGCILARLPSTRIHKREIFRECIANTCSKVVLHAPATGEARVQFSACVLLAACDTFAQNTSLNALDSVTAQSCTICRPRMSAR